MPKIKNTLLALSILLPGLAAAADPEMAQVVTFKEDVTKCLAPVEITTIDGKNRMLPRFGFEIEPGWHSLHGRAKVNLNRCPVVEERIRKTVHVEPLEWQFEAGKKYYVGFDHSSPNRENWRLIVWKVEDMDSDEDESDGSGEGV
ncbi:MAG: hypothetical protein R3348_04505 [Xanthomonadales bacterium]|nr:hypothetical protein [Xanthomonadales bacterium]